jgi:hypothetical protein
MRRSLKIAVKENGQDGYLYLVGDTWKRVKETCFFPAEGGT